MKNNIVLMMSVMNSYWCD